MEAADGFAHALKKPFDLHKAASVVAYDVRCAGFEDGSAFDFAHGSGDFGEFDGEGSAEAATRFGFGHLDEFESADVTEEGARGLLDAEFPETMAAVVEGDASVESGAEVGNAEFMDKKI